MTQLPPEHDDSDRAATDWHALLAGAPPKPAQPDAAASGGAQPEPPMSPTSGTDGRPMTRREAREAEQRQAAAATRGAAADPVTTPASPHGVASPLFDAVLADPMSADPLVAPGHPDESRSSRAARRAVASDPFEPKKPKRRGAWGCLIGLLIVVALGAVAFFFLQGPINAVVERFTPAADYSGSGTGEVVFMIRDGETGADIAENLVDEGVTASYDAFYDLLLEQSPEPEFHPGAYQLAEEMSAQAALDALVDPANKLENTFVIPEGTWANDALAVAAAATGIPIEEFQAAVASPQALGLPPEATSVEGFLFPATYTFAPGATAPDIVKMLVDRSIEALDAAGVPPESRWITVVKASLIQREAGLRDDYFKVSRVIENRLDPALFDSGLLQFDSTVHYGLGDDSVVTTTDGEREDPANPYNTYVHPGLPPGPIGNPGDLAIDAALHPAEGPWLYFVTVNLDTGETVFSATIEEHDAAVERFLAWLEEHPEYGG